MNAINSKNITILQKFELASAVKCLPKTMERRHLHSTRLRSFSCQWNRDTKIKLKSKGIYKISSNTTISEPPSENFF